MFTTLSGGPPFYGGAIQRAVTYNAMPLPTGIGGNLWPFPVYFPKNAAKHVFRQQVMGNHSLYAVEFGMANIFDIADREELIPELQTFRCRFLGNLGQILTVVKTPVEKKCLLWGSREGYKWIKKPE